MAARKGGPFVEDVTFDDARLVYKNFAGAKKKFNAEGDRNFHVVINPEQAKLLEELGWNIKWPKPKEIDGEEVYRDPSLKVKVSYSGRPPRIVLIGRNNRRTVINEDMCEMVDDVDIKKVDLIVHPYSWTNDEGVHGITAYLKTMFITVNQDELEARYADDPSDGQTPGAE